MAEVPIDGAPDARIPLFPLGLVLVPGLVLPLHVFEPRYRALVEDLAGRPEDQRLFGVVAIRSGREVGTDGVQALYEVGCTARLRRVLPLQDGRYEIVTSGERRFRMLGADATTTPYLSADVRWLDEPSGALARQLVPDVTAAFREYSGALAAAGGQAPTDLDDLPTEPTLLSYLVTASVVVDLEPRQRLLEQPDTSGRLEAALELLRHETTMLRTVRLARAPDLARQAYSPN